MDSIHSVSVFLDNYWARSQVFRTIQFSSAMLAGISAHCGLYSCSRKLFIVSNCINSTRITLRLLDDLPALLHTVDTFYKSKGASWLEVMDALCGQLYYPMEHLAWAADHQLVSLNSTHLWTAAILLWLIPLVINVLKLLCMLCGIGKPPSTTPTHQQQRQVLLHLVRYTCDLCLAVFWLPRGWLWGDRLPPSVWGLLGTVSSLLGLYQTIKSKQQLKDS